jgi:hypothetical protein
VLAAEGAAGELLVGEVEPTAIGASHIEFGGDSSATYMPAQRPGLSLASGPRRALTIPTYPPSSTTANAITTNRCCNSGLAAVRADQRDEGKMAALEIERNVTDERGSHRRYPRSGDTHRGVKSAGSRSEDTLPAEASGVFFNRRQERRIHTVKGT